VGAAADLRQPWRRMRGEKNKILNAWRKLTMKKMMTCALALSLILSLAACSSGGVSKNEITSAKLTGEQQAIVDLLVNDKQEILLFDYQTEETYKQMDVWVEVYKDGVLTDRPAGISMGNGTAYQHKGKLAIVIYQNPNFQWTITIDENDSQAIHRPIDTPVIAVDPTLTRAYGPMTGGAVIESGKEIILYSSVFTSGNTTITIDSQTLEERPEILKEYEYVHLIKCKFE
jgi:hypothetical protein